MKRLLCIAVVVVAWCGVGALAGQLRDDLVQPSFRVVPFYGMAVPAIDPCSPTGIGRAGYFSDFWRAITGGYFSDSVHQTH